jgi:hypothetical protein
MSLLQIAKDLQRIVPPSGVCEERILGEHHQESFLKARHVSQPLAMFCSDTVHLWVDDHSISSLTFTNDFPSLTWIYIFQSKNDIFEKFKDFKLLVENQANTKIKCLRNSFGEVYTNSIFQTFLKDHGTYWHETLSQEDEVVVSKNKVCFKARK